VKTLKGSADRPKQAMSVGNIPMKKNDNTYESTLADMDSPVLAAIVGLCPDMCPGAYCSRLTFFHVILFLALQILFNIPVSKQ
jgi:hypothetical protein